MKIELYGNRELLNIGKLELHTGEVHIWKLRWRELETFWNRHKPILEKEECQKAEHYRFHEDKMRYLAGKIAVRMLLKEYSGEDKIVLRQGKCGKLYWKASPGQRQITFNLSHSGEWVLAIFASRQAVGIDVQEMGEISEYMEIAQGYLNDEERTKEKFIIWETTGERLYSTGDMGRYWEDGNIEFLGRVDNQVKIAGYRVELGEIETILQTVTGIKSAIVVKKKLHNVDTMIAFYIEDEKNQTDSDKITMYLSQYLPKYMIPSVFIKVTEFPLGVNGKVDRILLADQKIPEQSNKQMSVEGMTELEEKILNVWKEILVQEINLDSDFFAAGGNSLQAVQLTNRLSEVFSKEVTIGELFENPSVRKMARLLGENNE